MRRVNCSTVVGALPTFVTAIEDRTQIDIFGVGELHTGRPVFDSARRAAAMGFVRKAAGREAMFVDLFAPSQCISLVVMFVALVGFRQIVRQRDEMCRLAGGISEIVRAQRQIEDRTGDEQQ
jgi:hypothetical protein